MNATTSPLRTVLILLCALAVPMALAAEDANKTRHHYYKLIDLGTLGGTRSYFSPGNDTQILQFSRVLNDGGAVAGLANTSLPDPFPDVCFDLEGDCLVTHAFEAHGDGKLKDLGALPGGGSSAATSISNNGLVAGLSQNGEIDPLLPAFSLPPFPETRAVLWRNGQIIDLGTLPQGGYESYATAVNSRGQVVGAAIDTVPDSNSMAVSLVGLFWLGPFPYETRAFLWEEDEGMQDLGTLPGSRDAQAILINEAGQVVGYSYTGTAPSVSGCPFPLTTGSFVWEKGKGMRDLGSFGGTCTFAMDLNDRGQIVGESTLTGDQAAHAFLWDHGVMHDLGGSLGGNFAGAIAINQSGRAVGFATLPGDAIFRATLWTRIGHVIDLGVIGADQCSQASSINAQMQIVGSSSPDCFATTVRAFLWEEGAMLDLNALIPADSALYLQFTETINSRGEIAGTGSDVHGNTHAFLLIPCDENHPDIQGCDYSLVDASAATRESAASVMQKPTTTAPRAPALYGPVNDVRRMFPGRLGSGQFVGGPQQAALSGAVAALSGPIVSLSPTGETFSTQPIGTTSAAKVVTLKNTGTTSVTINAIAIVGTNSGDFAQTHTCGNSLAAGASCSISVTIKPTASGTRTAALSVTDDAAGSPQKVGLTGVGTTAKLSLTRLSFGAVVLGTSSPAQTVTMTNVGTTTLTISAITVTGANAGDFAQTHTCGSSLAAGASCTVSVTFKPRQIGNRSGTLFVTDNAPGSPQTVSLSGTGTEVALSPTSLRFACFVHSFPVPRCVCFTSQTSMLTNVGRTTLNISGIAVSGPFSQTNSCGASVAAGGSCSINVRWSPGAGLLEPGSVSISDNGGASPQMLGLLAHKLCTPH